MRHDPFPDRIAAGRELGAAVARLGLADPLVLGLPRGGVVVAAEVARALGAELDVLVVRKIGHPHQPELGVGAVAEEGEPAYDAEGLRRTGLVAADLDAVVAAEQAECRRRVAAYRGSRPAPAVAGRDVVLVDDGIATGVTALAALHLLRGRGPARLVMAAPVGARDALARVSEVADDVVVLVTPHRFAAVSQWYDWFDQTSDDEVVALLSSA